MKILFVLGFPNPFPGAAWTRIGFFAKDWSKRGHSVEVLGTFSYTTLQKRRVRKSGEVNIFNLIFNMGLMHPLICTLNAIISFIVSTLFLLDKKPDVTVVSVPSGDVGLGALMSCKLLKAKCVVDYRDEWEDYTISKSRSKVCREAYKLLKALVTKIYMKSDLVTTETQPHFRVLASRGIKNVKMVPNGADTKVFKSYYEKIVRQKLGIGEDDFVIVYSGGTGGYYKLDVVIEAMAKLSKEVRSKVKLLIVGEGSDLMKIMAIAKDLGLKNNVLYLGVKNDKRELAEILSASDVGVIPYDAYPLWRNTLPAKFFECCACGVPVVATVYEVSILAKLIEEREVGLTVPPMDAEKLAEAILRIYENESFREAAGKRARLLIEEKFDRNKIAENFLKSIEAI